MFGSKLFTSKVNKKWQLSVRAKKKTFLPPFSKKNTFRRNTKFIFHHHIFCIVNLVNPSCCLWDCFRMAVWSVLILATRSTLEQTSYLSILIPLFLCVKHLAGWKTFNLWMVIGPSNICSSSTGVDLILWLSHYGMPCLNVACTVDAEYNGKNVPLRTRQVHCYQWDKQTKTLGALWTELIAHNVTTLASWNNEHIPPVQWAFKKKSLQQKNMHGTYIMVLKGHVFSSLGGTPRVWLIWSIVVLGSWVLDKTPSQSLNPRI